MSDFGICDDCDREQHPDEMIRVERQGCGDSYICEACAERRGEAQDGILWAQVDMTKNAGND